MNACIVLSALHLFISDHLGIIVSYIIQMRDLHSGGKNVYPSNAIIPTGRWSIKDKCILNFVQ